MAASTSALFCNKRRTIARYPCRRAAIFAQSGVCQNASWTAIGSHRPHRTNSLTSSQCPSRAAVNRATDKEKKDIRFLVDKFMGVLFFPSYFFLYFFLFFSQRLARVWRQEDLAEKRMWKKRMLKRTPHFPVNNGVCPFFRSECANQRKSMLDAKAFEYAFSSLIFFLWTGRSSILPWTNTPSPALICFHFL